MWRLFAKFKNEEWKEIDHLAESDSQNVESDKAYMLGEYKIILGSAYLLKWVKD